MCYLAISGQAAAAAAAAVVGATRTGQSGFFLAACQNDAHVNLNLVAQKEFWPGGKNIVTKVKIRYFLLQTAAHMSLISFALLGFFSLTGLGSSFQNFR